MMLSLDQLRQSSEVGQNGRMRREAMTVEIFQLVFLSSSPSCRLA
jgi:hypothetical protein